MDHTLILGYHTLKLGYHTLKSGYGNVKKIVKITVICPFSNRLIIWIYYFEVNMMTHLNFHDPAVKFFLDHQKKSHWNIELDNLVGVGGWIFPGHPLKGRPKNSSRGTKLLCTPTSKSCSLFETPWFNRQMMLLLIPCKKIASQHDCKNDCKNEFANMVEFFGIRKA